MSALKPNLLSRRQFSARGLAFSLAVPAAGVAFADGARRTVRFPDGTSAPALGQGAWHLGQDRHPQAAEADAVQTGLSLGMTLIDTSGNYGNGRSEKFLGQALAGQRERIFLVTKVEANEVAGDGIAHACEASLARLGTDHFDLYLLHSPVPGEQLPGVVAAFEKLKATRKIRAWGVSNFSRAQMEELFHVANGQHCATNQVSYSLNERGIERDLLPWCEQHNMPVMAYSPLGGDHHLVVNDPVLVKIGATHGCSAAAVALAWVIRSGKVIAIPESGTAAHTRENAAALSLTLTSQEIRTLDAAYPAPSR